jgi:O-antigen/teichoic acid export membrane protein
MISKFKKLGANSIVKGSAIAVVGTNLASFFAYIFHVLFGRLLGPVNYSELAAFISITTVFSASFIALGTVVVKFAAIEKEKNGVFFSWLTGVAHKIALFLFLVILFSTPFLSKFLSINFYIILFLPFVVVLAFYGSIFKSYLQGLLKFIQMVVSVNIDIIVRLLIGLLLVNLGLGVTGAVSAIFLGILIGVIIALFFLRKFVKRASGVYKGASKVYKYALPVLIMTVAMTSFITTDVILVKHYFAPLEAGLYSSLSTLGKIIIYGSIPVAGVMFPIVARRHEAQKRSVKVFLLSLLFTFAIAGSVLTIFYFFPTQSVTILFGEKYLSAAKDLFLFGMFSFLYVINYLIVYFYLSVNKTNLAYVTPIGALLQIVIIFILHESIEDIIFASITSSTILLLLLIISGLISYRHYLIKPKSLV